MKKIAVFLVMGLSIAMLAGGCKKDDSSNSSKDYKLSDHIKLGEYKGVEVTVEQLEVTDEDVETKIQTDLEAAATSEEVTDRPVQEGDIVNIDYEGLKDGVAFEGGTATGYDLTIGSGNFIEGFEEQIIGANKGDKLELNVTFPEDYTATDLAGQAVVFKVTVNAIKKSVVPELTEDFVTANTDYDTIDAYKTGVREDLAAENVETMKNNKINDVFNTIIENSEITSYPQTLIDEFKTQMTDNYTQYATQYGMELEAFIQSYYGMTLEDFNKELDAMAEEAVSQQLVFEAIIEAEGIELTDEEYQEGVTKIMTDYGFASEEEMLQSYDEETIRETLLWQKVLDFVTAEAKEV
ncbi:MAG: trigger factor [Herbinix sp.]|nr:trigger factor [Herbinix sp.]